MTRRTIETLHRQYFLNVFLILQNNWDKSNLEKKHYRNMHNKRKITDT